MNLCYCSCFQAIQRAKIGLTKGHSAVVSGMCFVHVFKYKYKYKYKLPVILSQTLFFIQEFLQAITRSKEK